MQIIITLTLIYPNTYQQLITHSNVCKLAPCPYLCTVSCPSIHHYVMTMYFYFLVRLEIRHTTKWYALSQHSNSNEISDRSSVFKANITLYTQHFPYAVKHPGHICEFPIFKTNLACKYFNIGNLKYQNWSSYMHPICHLHLSLAQMS